MTLPQLVQVRTNAVVARDGINVATANLSKVLGSLGRRLDTTDLIYADPTQAEVDAIVAAYTPIYTAAKAAILAAYNSLP